MVKLSDVSHGKSYVVDHIQWDSDAERSHMAAIGIVASATIQKIRKLPFGDPTQYLVSGEQMLAMNRQLADKIWVRETI